MFKKINMGNIMALIKCPECSKEISDKVKNCPHCGYPLKENEGDPQKVEVSSISFKSKDPTKRKKIITGIVVVLIIIIGAVFIINYQQTKAEEQAALELEEQQRQERNQYIDSLNLVTDTMYFAASEAENLLNLTARVWFNTIYQESDPETNKYTIKEFYYEDGKTSYSDYHFEDDFNYSLNKLYSDTEIKKNIEEMKESERLVNEAMKEIQNPTEELQGVYNTLLDLHSTFSGIINLASDPSGNLNSFSERKNELIDRFIEEYKKIEIQIPSKN
jgi:type II secretory pathway pseudopilin PulG